MSEPLTFLHAPRISAVQFRRVLEQYRSPCASMADECYAIIQRSGLDPAIALAFFAKESTFGTRGVTVETRNWGNVRTPFKPERAVGTHPRNFAIFPSWQVGLEDWCDRIRYRYVQQGLDTVDKAVPVYAPSSDGNDPQEYTAKVRELVQRWQREDPESYARLWGDTVPYHPTWGIPTRWRQEHDAGRHLGKAISPELYAGSVAVQLFELGDIRWQNGKATVYRAD